MRHYNVYLEVDGDQVNVGDIEGNSSEELQESGFDNAADIAERILLARKKVL